MPFPTKIPQVLFVKKSLVAVYIALLIGAVFGFAESIITLLFRNGSVFTLIWFIKPVLFYSVFFAGITLVFFIFLMPFTVFLPNKGLISLFITKNFIMFSTFLGITFTILAVSLENDFYINELLRLNSHLFIFILLILAIFISGILVNLFFHFYHKFKFKLIYATFFIVLLLAAIAIKRNSMQFNRAELMLTDFAPDCNIILIVLDAVRADHLSCYGYPKDTSPNINDLAKDGVLFAKAYSQSSATPATVTSILTSLYPVTHRVSKWDNVLSNEFATLPRILKTNNFSTAIVSEMSFIAKLHRFDKGIDYIYQNKSKFYVHSVLKDLLWWDVIYRGLKKITNISAKSENIFEASLAWIKERHREPFFLYIHSKGGHAPYLSPYPYNRIFVENETLRQTKAFLYPDPFSLYFKKKGKLSSYEHEGLVALYDGSIAYVDALVGDFINSLKALDLYENTIIVITADHGEEFAEHGSYQHGESLYEEIVHIPLIIIYPQKIPRGIVYDGLVQQIDISPTILDLIGIDVPPDFEGKSLVAVLKNSKKVINNFLFVSGDSSHGIPIQGIIERRYKLIITGLGDKRDVQLFDLKDDPEEVHNLAYKEPEITLELLQKIDEYYIAQVEKDKTSLTTTRLDSQFKEELKSLGYLQ